MSGQKRRVVFAGIGCDTVDRWLPEIEGIFPGEDIDPIRSPQADPAEIRDGQYLEGAGVIFVAGDKAMPLVAEAKRRRVANRMIFVVPDKPEAGELADLLVSATGGFTFRWKANVSTPTELAQAVRLHLQKVQRQG